MKTAIITAIFAFCTICSYAQQDNSDFKKVTPDAITEPIKKQKKLNFFIISKRKKGKLDLATRFNVLRSKIKSTMRPEKFVAIVAENAEVMSAKVRYRLEKYNATMGTIWFDSHGIYKKGHSLFQVGSTEVSFKTLKDSSVTKPFGELSAFATEETKLVIGSCYGGATYERSSIDYRDTTRMNGDSLMIGLGKIIKHGVVYGSESWVMTKPGLFKRKAAVGGAPGRKLFRDLCYEPVWRKVGVWNQYNVSNSAFQSVNPVALDPDGNLVIRGESFIVEKKFKKELDKKLSKLEADLYK
jgi:hypothetical protein